MSIRSSFRWAGLAALFCLPALALADWNPGDPYKMHYPQLPDPLGIDVKASLPLVLADDWKCTQSGPVTDVHIWGSWWQDQMYPDALVHLSIHANLPADAIVPYSRPGALLWAEDFAPSAYQRIIDGAPSPQTWWDPQQLYDPVANHKFTWQYNFLNISSPFYQEAGTIYWLDVSFFAGYGTAGDPLPLPQPFMFGWKNSISPQFMDDAVYRNMAQPPSDWSPLYDPRVLPPAHVSMDLAFVITPEPSTVGLLAIGGVVWLIRRRRDPT